MFSCFILWFYLMSLIYPVRSSVSQLIHSLTGYEPGSRFRPKPYLFKPLYQLFLYLSSLFSFLSKWKNTPPLPYIDPNLLAIYLYCHTQIIISETETSLFTVNPSMSLQVVDGTEQPPTLLPDLTTADIAALPEAIKAYKL